MIALIDNGQAYSDHELYFVDMEDFTLDDINLLLPLVAPQYKYRHADGTWDVEIGPKSSLTVVGTSADIAWLPSDSTPRTRTFGSIVGSAGCTRTILSTSEHPGPPQQPCVPAPEYSVPKGSTGWRVFDADRFARVPPELRVKLANAIEKVIDPNRTDEYVQVDRLVVLGLRSMP